MNICQTNRVNVFLILLLILISGLAACVGNAGEQFSTSVSSGDNISIKPSQISSGPLGYFRLDFSFPNGAPRLNEAAVMKLAITGYYPLKDTKVIIDLPGGLELVSGDLTWSGNIGKGEIKDIVSTVRAVKEGDYDIKATFSYPEQLPAGAFTSEPYLYVLIGRDGSKWESTKSYNRPSWRPGIQAIIIPAQGGNCKVGGRMSDEEIMKILHNPPATTTSTILSDGSIKSSDGSILHPDGTLVLPDGTIKHVYIPNK